MRQARWTPSIVAADEPTLYLVADDFGRAGSAWREADLEIADLEAVIQDLIAGDIASRSGSCLSTRRSAGRKMSLRMSPAKSDIAAICN
ncbi:hypothetical protein [Bradyrhizobium japonicum]|uniref:hypothetical protein n=1 Tax=Bradyrhizobium japonicum TaxID=375 RepID=UPI0027148429|nr:hypothetical protein [Bradyrhizobium japonicum]WLB24236.1 hypothetical protein QIH95_47575 [Bradyrhizobium japonicum]